MKFLENDLLETPVTQHSAEKTNGAQAAALPVTSMPNGGTSEPVQIPTQPTIKPNGSAGSTETQTIAGGSIFDPARWKTAPDSRLDPKAEMKPVFSKIEVRKPPPDHYVRVHPDPVFNGIFPLYGDSLSKRYEPY
jgi:hypothetical protein